MDPTMAFYGGAPQHPLVPYQELGDKEEEKEESAESSTTESLGRNNKGC